MKFAIGMTLVFGAIATFMWSTVPRLMSDLWHAGDFVAAQSYAIKDYKCTNVNLFMFHHCTVTFISLPSGKSRQAHQRCRANRADNAVVDPAAKFAARRRGSGAIHGRLVLRSCY